MSIIDELKEIGFEPEIIGISEDNDEKYIYSNTDFRIEFGESVFDAPIIVKIKGNKMVYVCVDIFNEYEIELCNINTVAQIKKLIEALKGE